MQNEVAKTFDPAASCKAQAAHVAKTGAPHFAPSDGRCFRCRENIYREIKRDGYASGIHLEKAASQLITGCPHCHYSYCE